MQNTKPTPPISKQQWIYALLAIFTGISALMGVDIYIPAMPDMARELNTTPHGLQMTITIYLLAIGFACLFYGPLSDKIGRKPTMLIGLITGLLGIIIIILSHSITQIIIGRFIQGIGASVGICIATSILMDILHDAKQISKITSYLATFMGLSPLLAPLLGGYLTHLYHWRACFIFLAAYLCILLLIYIFYFKETLSEKNHTALNPTKLIKNYWFLISNKTFLIMCICAGITISLIISYASIAPFLFIDFFKISTVTFGWVTLGVGLSNMLSKFANSLVIKKISLLSSIKLGMYIAIFGGVIIIISIIYGYNNLPNILAGVLITQLSIGLIIANTPAIALTPMRHMAGAASAMYRSIQQSCAFITSAIITAIPWHNSWALGISYLLLGLCGVILLKFMPKS